MENDLRKKILQLKKDRNAIILAHNYQIDQIQDIADFVGDSFVLSQKAALTEQDVIVFCGVSFMAETAAILAPEKTVLLPEVTAGCPMADMVTAESLREAKQKYPEAAVVCYVNSSAEVKAESDICCTSANAIRIVDSLTEKQVLFVPDRNLAHWVSLNSRKEIIPWAGYCPIHDQITLAELDMIRKARPGVPIAIHPESHPDLVAQADFVGSTGGILDFARKSEAKEIIIGTEMGILHRLKQENPEKKFYVLSDKLVCPDMKYTTLEKLATSLETMQTIIKVPEEIGRKARLALERMLAVG